MRIDGANIPTNPYHIARAYGAQNTQSPAGVQPTQRPAALAAQQGTGAQSQPSAAQRLVAAVVPGRVDFSGDTPRPGAPTLQLYRHPADKNAAATGVLLGKSLDVSG